MLEQLEQKLMVDQILCIKTWWNDKAKLFYFSAVSYFNVLLGVLTCMLDKSLVPKSHLKLHNENKNGLQGLQ
jgi:hypothetical protein